jgi:hypothetical protein
VIVERLEDDGGSSWGLALYRDPSARLGA